MFDSMYPFWSFVFSVLIAQLAKPFWALACGHKFNLRLITSSGGMPSSHSSFVTSLATLVGLEKGFNSTDFAIVVVFALIIMYDASGVRRAVGKQAAILNQIVDDVHHGKHIKQDKLKELIGHTPVEVWMGAILGIVVALVMV